MLVGLIIAWQQILTLQISAMKFVMGHVSLPCQDHSNDQGPRVGPACPGCLQSMSSHSGRKTKSSGCRTSCAKCCSYRLLSCSLAEKTKYEALIKTIIFPIEADHFPAEEV